jgi:Transposase
VQRSPRQECAGPQTDATDAVWLAQLCEVGLLRGSFIPPAEIAAVRELTRYRRKLTEERTRETQRLHKVLEDGGIKLDSVASDSLGVSGRAMITALIAGERDPAVLADLARGLMRKKIPDLTLALAGRFAAHHGLLAGLHLNHIDHLNTMIGQLEVSIDEAVAPFARQRDLLTTLPALGSGPHKRSSPRSAWTCHGSTQPTIWPRGQGCVLAITSPLANGRKPPLVTATLNCAACWWSRRGPSHSRKPVWVRAFGASIAGSARRVERRQPSRSRTPSW